MPTYTSQQQQEIKEQFVARRKRQWVVAALFIPVFVLLVMSGEGKRAVFGIEVEALMPLVGIVVIGAVVFSLRNWRCPACNRYLGKNANPSFCLKCGVALR